MIQLLTVIGARPQIIKASAISRAIETRYRDRVCEHLLHTGQHYDANMSEVFFDELGIPTPEYNLQVGSLRHGAQTARMIEGIEQVLVSEHYDGVLIYGDTNSTLAAAIAASKLHVPVFHVEAGLRSYNMAMPEEINRVVCDRLASLLFAPTRAAIANLEAEGANGKGQKVILSGDVMYDNALYFGQMAETRSRILAQQGLQKKDYVLATVHRPANTDDALRLGAIFEALLTIAEEKKQTIVLPLHPRTRKQMETLLPEAMLHRIRACEQLRILPPASYLDMICMEKNAALVLTDSGGVQKEAFFYGTPVVILRNETEWVEIVESGAAILADADYTRILTAYEELLRKRVTPATLYGDGHAAEMILNELIEYCA